MAYKRVADQSFDIDFVSGDTEYIRLITKGTDGAIIDITSSTQVIFGVKRKVEDSTYIVDQIVGDIYTYDAVTQPYNIEIVVPSLVTQAMRTYNGKDRKSVELYYDVELTGTEGITTLLAGKLTVVKSISGIV